MITWLIYIGTSIIGAQTTFWFNQYKNWGPLKASAILSLIVAIPFEFLELPKQLDPVPYIFFGASFVGMATRDKIKPIGIGLASIAFGALTLLLEKEFSPFGGTLGTTACLSCLIILSGKKLLKRR